MAAHLVTTQLARWPKTRHAFFKSTVTFDSWDGPWKCPPCKIGWCLHRVCCFPCAYLPSGVTRSFKFTLCRSLCILRAGCVSLFGANQLELLAVIFKLTNFSLRLCSTLTRFITSSEQTSISSRSNFLSKPSRIWTTLCLICSCVLTLSKSYRTPSDLKRKEFPAT